MIQTAILGATGFVGQRFIQLLENHPWFEATVLAASERSVGKRYGEASHWLLDTPMPEGFAEKTVVACTPEGVLKAAGGHLDLIFSCLPNELAGPTEEAFAKAGIPVISKASAHRMDQDVPLVIPEVNPEHDDLISAQQKARGWKDGGFISCDPNCSTTPLALTLKPLMMMDNGIRIKHVHVTTLQALSGAGYPGVASLDALGNVVPYIGHEEEKIERETLKILGQLNKGKDKITHAALTVSASCNRVPVVEGHLENVFVEFDTDGGGKSDKVDLTEILTAWKNFHGEPEKQKLPSAQKPIVYLEGENRPQHRLDVMTGKGMTTTVGRLRLDGPNRIKYSCLSHNTIQGAAGGAILHAELLNAKGVLGTEEMLGEKGVRG
ncbi:aspartate-semialdehyde dehydrogenase [Candidatus Micrarchaeota archaeon]|nr:aspartate-semialdehyde dehydrogenase [Candidatus Micrarchaeota archaeon]